MGERGRKEGREGTPMTLLHRAPNVIIWPCFWQPIPELAALKFDRSFIGRTARDKAFMSNIIGMNRGGEN